MASYTLSTTIASPPIDIVYYDESGNPQIIVLQANQQTTFEASALAPSTIRAIRSGFLINGGLPVQTGGSSVNSVPSVNTWLSPVSNPTVLPITDPINVLRYSVSDNNVYAHVTQSGSQAQQWEMVGIAAIPLNIQGAINASGNPNYPGGLKGDLYYVTVAGLLGGSSGISVAVGDSVVCVNANAGGTQAEVGADWIIWQAIIPGLSTVGLSLASITLPGVSSFIQVNVNGSVTTLSASAMQAALGLGAAVLTSGSYSNPTWITGLAASKITGNLAVANFNSGTNASASTFFRGDGVWAVPPVGGNLFQYVAFLASSGDDSTGVVGDPTHPFVTGQAAFAAIVAAPGWVSLGCGILAFKFLPSAGADGFNAGSVALANYNYIIYVEGLAFNLCHIAFTASAGYSIVISGNGRDNVSADATANGGGSITAYGVTGSFTTAGTSYSGTNTGAAGGAAGPMIIDLCAITGISATSGNGDSAPNILESAMMLMLDPTGWDGFATNVVVSGPGGSDTYLWGGIQFNYQYGNGISYAVGNEIVGNSTGSGYGYATDNASNVDGQISFIDGVTTEPMNGGAGGNGPTISIKRCQVELTSIICQAGVGGAGENGGSTGATGTASPSVLAYWCEINGANALNTTDASPWTAQERFCIEAGVTVESQN
jgi:hypothetical protein